MYPVVNLRRLGVGARVYVEGLEDAMVRTAGVHGVCARVRRAARACVTPLPRTRARRRVPPLSSLPKLWGDWRTFCSASASCARWGVAVWGPPWHAWVAWDLACRLHGGRADMQS
jgi:hypothetical protein